MEGWREGADWNQWALAGKDGDARRYANLNPNINPKP
jgi:hypothetical protein